MSKHTPGMWAVAPGNGALDGAARWPTDAAVLVYANDDCDCHPIADCSCNHTCRDEFECAANARLIAAAPDLLKSLQRCIEYGDLLDELAEEARAAIRKATEN